MKSTAVGSFVRARGVSREYGSGAPVVHALRGVDLDVASGETLAIMGPSGCGKSTLLHVLGGLDRVTDGELWLGGQRVDQLSETRWALLRRRSVLFLVSDFLAEGWRPVLGRLARRHDVIAVHLVDPRERTLPDVGLVALQDAETGAWRWVDTASPVVREQVRSGAARFEGELESTVEQSGADLLRLDAGEPYGERRLAFFRRRERALAR